VKDLKGCAGALVELVVRVVDARQRVTYHPAQGGNGRGGPGGDGGYGTQGGYGGYGGAGAGGGSDDEEPDPGDRWSGGYGGNGNGNGAKYFYIFEDETGLLEGVGETRCVTYGTPPVCFLRGEVRKDGEGVAKITKCTFLRSF